MAALSASHRQLEPPGSVRPRIINHQTNISKRRLRLIRHHEVREKVGVSSHVLPAIARQTLTQVQPPAKPGARVGVLVHQLQGPQEAHQVGFGDGRKRRNCGSCRWDSLCALCYYMIFPFCSLASSRGRDIGLEMWLAPACISHHAFPMSWHLSVLLLFSTRPRLP